MKTTLEVKRRLMKLAREVEGLSWADRLCIGEAIGLLDQVPSAPEAAPNAGAPFEMIKVGRDCINAAAEALSKVLAFVNMPAYENEVSRALSGLRAMQSLASETTKPAAPAQQAGAPLPLAPSDAGLSIAQEPKYTVNGHAIVNRATGEAIPPDEPAFVFRARDALGVQALTAYLSMIGEREPASAHADAVRQRIADFQRFAAEHPRRMKWPDTAPATATPPQATLPASEPVAPWPDFLGQPIRHGDRLVHPADGSEFVAVYLPQYATPGDQWRAIYTGEVIPSRLCLQIGEKGRAALATRAQPQADAAEPVAWPKLEKPARVVCSFGVGVSSRLVVQAAQRHYERTADERIRTPEQRREDEMKRRAAWDLFNGFTTLDEAQAPGAAEQVPNTFKQAGETEEAWIDRITGATQAPSAAKKEGQP